MSPKDQEAFEISLTTIEGDAVVVDPKKVVVLIGVNDDANGVLIFESFGNDPAGGKSVIPGIHRVFVLFTSYIQNQ